jgi:hypothetical protein
MTTLSGPCYTHISIFPLCTCINYNVFYSLAKPPTPSTAHRLVSLPDEDIVGETDLVHGEGDAVVEERHHGPAHKHHQGDHPDVGVEQVSSNSSDANLNK